jgi:hypothetical protein
MMKKIILVCGLISGALVSGFMAVSMIISYNSAGGHGSMVVGYASMILAFSLIFVAIKNYRDKHQNGQISFGKGFKIGILIALIASTLYVLTWLVVLYTVMPDYMDKYTETEMENARKAGLSASSLQEISTEMEGYREMYKNPLFVFLFTYVEILPVGILVSLIAALILRRRSPVEPLTAN